MKKNGLKILSALTLVFLIAPALRGNAAQAVAADKLIGEPKRLTYKASEDDGLSAAALVGPWESTQNRMNIEYGFSDDGYFYKNTMINMTYSTSTYHSAQYRYLPNYTEVTSGYWTYQINPSYTYLDTLVGEYRVRGGVIEFDHVVAISRTTFEDDWYREKTRSVSMDELQRKAQKAKIHDDFSAEFEFISPTRVRFRACGSDIDLFWDIENDKHNVKIPKHEIPAVDWPKKALSPEMPEFGTKGRVREASLGDDDKDIADEFKTVSVVIDKATALTDIEAYGSALRKSGWWVEDYKLGGEDISLSYEARKGMFRLKLNNGNGSHTDADTVVIESTKYPEGQWPNSWSKSGLEQPDKSTAVGEINSAPDDSRDILQTIIFDNVDDGKLEAYRNKLIGTGFKKPQNSSNDWELTKYIRIDKDLYRAEIGLDKRMDRLSSLSFRLDYVPDGIWPEIWKNGGLITPEGIETIAGAIDVGEWRQNLALEDGTDYKRIKFLGLDTVKTEVYLNKLKTLGFMRIENEYSEDIEFYNYLRIDGKLCRVEIRQIENDELTEFSYAFNRFVDGEWPALWTDAGLSAPEGIESVAGVIDVEEWQQNLAKEDSSFYKRIKFLGLNTAGTEAYLKDLETSGFRRTGDTDEVALFAYLRIDGKLFRVEIRQVENDELTELSYAFNRFVDGEWPEFWADAGLTAPEGAAAIVGAIDAEGWKKNLAEYDSGNERIKFLGLDAAKAETYLDKLKASGFKRIQDEYSEDIELYNYLRIDGCLYRVEVRQLENDELTEFNYSFNRFVDGEWPRLWADGGIPAPSCTAIVGAIDMSEFDENISDWGGYYANIRLLGANLSDYRTALRKSGFSEQEDSYTDTWELEKRVKIGGVSMLVTVSDTGNAEIPEVNFSFKIEDE